jgi:hypothetical protein
MIFAMAGLALCAAQTVFAQTTLITHQGKLDFDGVPAAGNYDFQFRVFDAASGGVQQGLQDEHLNVTVTNGAYTVNIDFGAAVFSGADRFLEISVRATGTSTYTTQSPREQITSTPYSIRSRAATTADGLSVTCASCVSSGQIQNVQGSQVTGNVAGSQISGHIPVASVPPGSFSYIQNTTSQQIGHFNIGGSGTVGGTLSGNLVNATTQYNIGGQRVLGIAAGAIRNMLVGPNAGIANTTGFENSFFGFDAGRTNTTGLRNSFFGADAGRLNATGSLNSFFGTHAGQSNTTGNSNSFFGSAGGFSNTTGSYNSFFGDETGENNTQGGNNSFFGAGTGHNNTTGQGNSSFGRLAGYNNTTANDNSFFGVSAGYNTVAGQNAFFGASAGQSNTTGNLNAFVGANSGFNSTTGLYNSFFGGSAGTSNTTGSFNTFIGVGADFNSPNPIGDNNTLLGYNTRVNSGVSNSTAIGSGAQATVSNTVILGTKLETVIVRGKLQVDMLGTGGSVQLCLNNSSRLAPCSSSLRYKTDLLPFNGGLSLINRLQPISFTWKDGGIRDLGFGAEEVQKIEPLLVTYNAQGLVEGVKYDRISAVLVNAIKEQQQQIAEQQRQIEELTVIKADNAELRARLADLLARLEQIEKAYAARK